VLALEGVEPQLLAMWRLTLLLPLAACGDAQPALPDAASAIALLGSSNADDRFEAVVRLGALAPAAEAMEGLAQARKDEDPAVRLMAAIGEVASGTGPIVRLLETSTPDWNLFGPNDPWSPDPDPLVRDLREVDPWLFGTLLPGMMVAARDPDPRVRALAVKALAVLRQRDEIGFREVIRSASRDTSSTRPSSR
jgi:HEAT repeat protein